jgi:hypothetical protein
VAKYPGTRATEKRLHSAFAEYKTSGEWFEMPPLVGLQIWRIIHEAQNEPEPVKKPRRRSGRKHPACPPRYMLQPRNNAFLVMYRRPEGGTKYAGWINKSQAAELRRMSVDEQRAWILNLVSCPR